MTKMTDHRQSAETHSPDSAMGRILSLFPKKPSAPRATLPTTQVTSFGQLAFARTDFPYTFAEAA